MSSSVSASVQCADFLRSLMSASDIVEASSQGSISLRRYHVAGTLDGIWRGVGSAAGRELTSIVKSHWGCRLLTGQLPRPRWMV